MEGKIKTEGKCVFCDKTFSKATINRHLKTHLSQKVKTETPGTSYYVKVELSKRWGITPYFLYLWVSDKTTLEKIDSFLRDIWLECCGHMSSFEEKNKKQNFNWDFDNDVEFGIKMKTKTGKLFTKDLVLDYQYDFGSTTELQLTVIEELLIATENPITLLSRNEPLKTLCESCKKEPATEICTVHNWDEDSMFCNKCAKKHSKICEDFEDYAAMPIVNSPRMGTCAYNGGTIDIERDR